MGWAVPQGVVLAVAQAIASLVLCAVLPEVGLAQPQSVLLVVVLSAVVRTGSPHRLSVDFLTADTSFSLVEETKRLPLVVETALGIHPDCKTPLTCWGQAE